MRGEKIIFIALLLALIYGLVAFGFYAGVASKVPGANDYYSRWMGARLLFLKGIDPYSEIATHQIQMGMYGRLARPDEDQVAFAYPLYAVFFTLPFIGLQYGMAESLWIALLFMLVGGAGVALATQSRSRLSPLGLIGLLSFVLAFYPTLRGLFLGQYTLIVFACLSFSLVLIGRGRDGWAGVLLALCMVKPHVALLVVLTLMAWSLIQRRWRLFAGFGITLGFLAGSAMLLIPGWPVEFLTAIGRYQEYIQIGPPVQVWSETLVPAAWAGALSTGLSILLVGTLVLAFARTVRGDWEQFFPTLELSLLVTTLAMIRTATTDQALLLILWIHWLGNLTRIRPFLAVGVALGVVVIPWAIFLATLQGNQEAPVATTGAVTLTALVYVLVHSRVWKEWIGLGAKVDRSHSAHAL